MRARSVLRPVAATVSSAEPRSPEHSLTDPDPKARPHLRLVADAASLRDVSDEDLMCRHRDGEPGCFDVLVERYRGRLYGFLRRHGSRPQRAEELVADVFLKIHRAAPRYQPTAKFSTYLYTVARRASLNARGRMAVRLEVAAGGIELDGVLGGAADVEDPERTAEARRSVARLQTELDALPEGHRAAFSLYYVEGMSCAAVAEALDISAAEAKGRLAYARKLLRQRLAGQIPEATPESKR